MYCKECGGTGRDSRRTVARAAADAEFKHRVKHHGSYVACWACNGNGLDPAEFHTWGPYKQLQTVA